MGDDGLVTDEFVPWLAQLLNKRCSEHADVDVFCTYIASLLDDGGEESAEDQLDALNDIVSQICTADDAHLLCKEILTRWGDLNASKQLNKDEKKMNVDEQLVNMLENQKITNVVTTRTLTEEEKRVKQNILAQYSQVCDEDTEESEEEEAATGHDPTIISGIASVDAFLAKNDNAAAVQQAEREKREKSKVDSEKKKAQDKLNREKQKEAKQDRKEKEKKRTQKGERRR